MAQNVTIAGASYREVPAIDLPKAGGGTARFVDTSGDTVTPEVLAAGYSAHNAAGEEIIGKAEAKNVQAVLATTDIKSTSYTRALSLTVAKTGVYNVSWIGIRNSTSGTNGSQLYVNGTAYGSANTTFQSGNTYMQQPYLTNVSLTEGQTIEVRARSRTTAAAMTIGNFVIAEV